MTQKINVDIFSPMQQIGNNTVRTARKKNLENGIPNSYTKNGVLYFQLPDGPITMENHF